MRLQTGRLAFTLLRHPARLRESRRGSVCQLLHPRKDAVTNLVEDLRDADEQAWLDQRLAGCEAWWRAIHEQIRGCVVFVFALSLLLDL